MISKRRHSFYESHKEMTYRHSAPLIRWHNAFLTWAHPRSRVLTRRCICLERFGSKVAVDGKQNTDMWTTERGVRQTKLQWGSRGVDVNTTAINEYPNRTPKQARDSCARIETSPLHIFRANSNMKQTNKQTVARYKPKRWDVQNGWRGNSKQTFRTEPDRPDQTQKLTDWSHIPI